MRKLVREQNHDSGEEERGGNERIPTENEETEKDELEGGETGSTRGVREETGTGEMESGESEESGESALRCVASHYVASRSV